jgi:hypothetical protein
MEPKFFAEFNALLADTPIDQIRTYLRWHLLHAYAGTSLPESFDQENWNFYSHTLNGAEKQQERWKRCTSRVDRGDGRGAGPGVRGALFSARREAAHPRDDAGHRAGHGQGHRRAGLDERRDQGQGQRKAARGDEQDRLSG